MLINKYNKFQYTWGSCCNFWKKLSNKYKLFSYFFYSLFYNYQFDLYYFIDTIFDPFFYFIDHYLKYLGTTFVVVVFIILFSFILFAYILGVPYWYHRSKLILSFAWIIGHWLLINVLWNYFKSLFTLPGYATDKTVVIEVTSFCKKCLVPKPPRCHHCSVCNKCILKMDHHCPWLNNCIGHYNFRYFFFFCVYTWLGTIFVMVLGVWPALDHWFPQFSPFMPINIPSDDDIIFIRLIEIINPNLKTKIMLFEAIITILLFILLGLLLRYHIKLITNGETSIERCINKKCRKHYAKYNVSYLNPYDFGVEQNWKLFLGFDRNLYPWKNIFLPSNYKPVGDGFSWQTISNDQLNL